MTLFKYLDNLLLYQYNYSFIIMNCINTINRSAFLLKSILGDPVLPKNLLFIEKIKMLASQIEQYSKIPNKLEQVLTEIHNALHNCTIQTAKKISIERKLAKAAKILQAPKAEVKRLPCIQIPTQWTFFCDLDLPDYNGVIYQDVLNAVRFQIPFITTRSILNNRVEFLAELKINSWEVFKFGAQFLIFFPSSNFPIPKEKILAYFDFREDGLIIPIVPHSEILHSDQQASFEDFLALFAESAQQNKICTIMGHGNDLNVAGLSSMHYQRFLKFLKLQKCYALTVSSCKSGGKASLLNFPAPSFPVIVKSIGDFNTFNERAEENHFLYSAELKDLIEKGPLTKVNVKKTFKKMEQGQSKAAYNLVQILYPSSAICGFRPVGEQGRSYSLTFTDLQRSKIENKRITVKDKDFIEIHPLEVNCSLVFIKKLPILLSMIPGNAQHYIKKIVLDADQSPAFFLKQLHEFYKKGQPSVNKAFFISEISSINASWSQVAIFISCDGLTCLYKNKGNFYFEGRTNYRISQINYAVLLREILFLSKPDHLAVISQTGGQEDEDALAEPIAGEFWLNEPNLFHRYPFFQKNIRTNNHALNWHFKICSKSDADILISYFFKNNQIDFAEQLIEKRQMTMDDLYVDGIPILIAAAREKRNSFIEFLINKGVNINIQDPKTGSSALHIAAADNNLELMHLLLKHINCDTEIADFEDRTALFHALLNNSLEAYQALRKSYALLDVIDCSGQTPLSLACQLKLTPQIQDMLQGGVNCNLGNSKPLINAIQEDNYALAQSLFDHGAKLPKNFSIIESMTYCSSKLIELIISRPDFNPHFIDPEGRSALSKALQIAHESYISALLEKNAHIQSPSLLVLNEIFEGLNLIKSQGKRALLECILSHRQCPAIENRLFQLLRSS